MKKFKTGLLGYGNMAQAIVNGILENGVLKGEDIYVYDPDPEKMASLQEKNINGCGSISDVAENAQIIFLCVKPNIVPIAAREIKITDRAVVSIAAGVRTEKLQRWLPEGTRILRVMPNTPLLVGKGATCAQVPNHLTAEEHIYIYHIFSKLGIIKEVAEEQMDAVTGVSGSGPAYAYLFIDAVARAGEVNGLAYEDALELSLQTFAGAAEMLRKTGEQPEDLIHAVCSPGGTTIEAMRVFEEQGIREIVNQAVSACVKRSKELSK